MQGSVKHASSTARPATGKLGILTPGLGAVATTFMAGVESVRRGPLQADRLAHADGDDPPRQAHREPRAADQGLRSARRRSTTSSSARGIRSPTTPTPPRRRPACSRSSDLEPLKDFLSAIKPMPAVFDNKYVTRINGTNVKKGKTKRDLAEQLRQDIRDFKAKNKCDRVVIVWCASTEIFIKPGPQHATLEQFEKAMENNDEAIAPSMLYAYAAIMEGVPFCNGAPNLVGRHCRRCVQLANERACRSPARTSRPARPG